MDFDLWSLGDLRLLAHSTDPDHHRQLSALARGLLEHGPALIDWHGDDNQTEHMDPIAQDPRRRTQEPICTSCDRATGPATEPESDHAWWCDQRKPRVMTI